MSTYYFLTRKWVTSWWRSRAQENHTGFSSCSPETQMEHTHSCVIFKYWNFKSLGAMCVDSGVISGHTFWRFRHWVFVRLQLSPGQVVFQIDVWSQNNRFCGLIIQKIRNQFKRLSQLRSATNRWLEI